MSRALKYVEPTTKAPLGAIVFFLCIGVAFVTAWTNESPTVAFAAVSGINANGATAACVLQPARHSFISTAFLMVYGIPSLLRFTSGLRTFTATKDFNLRWLSIPFAVIGASYGAFSNATIALPNLYPQGTNTINVRAFSLHSSSLQNDSHVLRAVRPHRPRRNHRAVHAVLPVRKRHAHPQGGVVLQGACCQNLDVRTDAHGLTHRRGLR